MTMAVVVTGGAGFIGSHSVDALLRRGAQVRVFDNFSSGKWDNLPKDNPRLIVIDGDVRHRSHLRSACLGATHILHLAAQVSVQQSLSDPVSSAQQNIVGFIEVLEAARATGIRRVVYASSAAVYGAPQQLPLTEDSAVAPMSPYGLEKAINDQYAQMYRGLYGLTSLGLRYFNVYGPRQDPASPYAGVISRFVDRARDGQALRINGDGQQTRDFVNVRDVAELNVRALQSENQGIFNVGTGRSVSLLDLARELGQALGQPLTVEHAEPARGDIRESAMHPAKLQQALGPMTSRRLSDGLRELVQA